MGLNLYIRWFKAPNDTFWHTLEVPADGKNHSKEGQSHDRDSIIWKWRHKTSTKSCPYVGVGGAHIRAVN